ncbi:hypothetical protein RJ641_025379 [Dillenia turbinata]|uniref:Uncharacterized protein n=1 Tax=Dillenia turbinata TaxID=194707 RepID=A0AAN8WE67_9MAGN
MIHHLKVLYLIYLNRKEKQFHNLEFQKSFPKRNKERDQLGAVEASKLISDKFEISAWNAKASTSTSALTVLEKKASWGIFWKQGSCHQPSSPQKSPGLNALELKKPVRPPLAVELSCPPLIINSISVTGSPRTTTHLYSDKPVHAVSNLRAVGDASSIPLCPSLKPPFLEPHSQGIAILIQTTVKQNFSNEITSIYNFLLLCDKTALLVAGMMNQTTICTNQSEESFLLQNSRASNRTIMKFELNPATYLRKRQCSNQINEEVRPKDNDMQSSLDP